MKFFRKAVDFYLNSSIHVGFSCFSLVQISQYRLNISKDFLIANFAFFGAIVSYNFIKYWSLIECKKDKVFARYQGLLVLTTVSFLASIFCLLYLQLSTQIIVFVLLVVMLVYVFPFSRNTKNVRNRAGIKIYIVVVCWVCVTVVLPTVNDSLPTTVDFYVLCAQRVLIIFALLFNFEIIDLKVDVIDLQTIPQQIGVKSTKILGFFLLIVFCLLNFLYVKTQVVFLLTDFIIAAVVAVFLAFAHQERCKYYTSFWVESIPIVWWLLILLLQ